MNNVHERFINVKLILMNKYNEQLSQKYIHLMFNERSMSV